MQLANSSSKLAAKTRAEWGRRVLAAALRRLRARRAKQLAVEHCRIVRYGERWDVRLTCRILPVAGMQPAGVGPAPRRLTGRGTALLHPSWLPGDPRLGRRLQLALANALAEVAEQSGLGLGILRW